MQRQVIHLTEIKHEVPIEFPAVTVCNLNPFDQSDLDDVGFCTPKGLFTKVLTRLPVGHRPVSVITGMACHWWVSSLVRLARMNIDWVYPQILCKPQCIVGSCDRWETPPFSDATDGPLQSPNEIPCH